MTLPLGALPVLPPLSGLLAVLLVVYTKGPKRTYHFIYLQHYGGTHKAGCRRTLNTTLKTRSSVTIIPRLPGLSRAQPSRVSPHAKTNGDAQAPPICKYEEKHTKHTRTHTPTPSEPHGARFPPECPGYNEWNFRD